MKHWLICSKCGNIKEIFSEQEIYDNEECFLCGGNMILDLNQGKKLKEPIGDNFPKIPNDFISDISICEQEIVNSINLIGNNMTWELIEAISNVKERIKYRNIFFKYRGIIPEKGNIL